MLWHLRRRTLGNLDALLANCGSDRLTYSPSNCSLGGPVPPTLTRRSWGCVLEGHGCFERASAVIKSWGVHRGAGLTVESDGTLAAGTNVVIEAPLPVGFITATCRVVAVVDETDRFGFAYGTLSHHPERGEESFIVRREPGGAVNFEIVAASSPAHLLARTFPPIADRLQEAATHRYLKAMSAAMAAG